MNRVSTRRHREEGGMKAPTHHIRCNPINILMASPTEPMPDVDRKLLIAVYRALLDRLFVADDTTVTDWNHVNFAVNWVQAMCENEYAEYTDELLEVRRHLRIALQRFYRENKPIRITAEGFQVVDSLLSELDDVLQQLSHRQSLKLMAYTAKREMEMRRGKCRAGDVTIASLKDAA